MKKSEQEIKKSVQIKAGLFILFIFIFCSVTFYSYQILFTDNLLVNKSNKALFIPRGADFKQVVDSLEKGGFLHDKLSFMFLSKLLGYRDHIMPGFYEIDANSSNFTLFRKLIKGRQTPIKLTINNIRTKSDFCKRIASKLEIDSISMYKALSDNNTLKQFGFNDTTVMTLFIPDTYEVYWTIKPEELIEYFDKEYRKFWNRERLSKARQMGFSPIQVTILASIIEAETQRNDEKKRIAGVYMNRYKAGQRLQADPTLIFATQDFNAKRVNEFHRYYVSPYNTYRRKGLPPGPINLPSVSSIDAVLDYEKNDFFFFCARPDLSGYHLFSKTFDDHLKIAKDYWKSLDKANIHQSKRQSL